MCLYVYSMPLFSINNVISVFPQIIPKKKVYFKYEDDALD